MGQRDKNVKTWSEGTGTNIFACMKALHALNIISPDAYIYLYIHTRMHLPTHVHEFAQTHPSFLSVFAFMG